MAQQSSNQSGLELFFDISRTEELGRERDNLGWEELKGSTVDNIDRARFSGNFEALRETSGFSDTVGNFSVPKCFTASDCASNFTCVGGQCVSWNQAGETSQPGAVLLPGGTTGNATCDEGPSQDCELCPRLRRQRWR